ncbi:MAG: shikimate dehydrogenase [Cyanobium sp.]
MGIGGATALVGVLGDPVRHSLSPAMHNAALQELGLDWVYLALPTPAAQLAAVLEGLRAVECRGLNVTLPHKQAVARLCQGLSPLAERVGAVNTLIPQVEGGWQGTNTDVEGFLAPLKGQEWAGREALVLGCGGSARAVVAALVELGLARIRIAARRLEPLERFVADCRTWAPQLEALEWASEEAEHSSCGSPLLAPLQTAALVVNTTPVGMASASTTASAEDAYGAKGCPLTPAELEALAPGCSVYDLIYTPRPTRLLAAAADRGYPTVDGLEMLVQQGAAALRLWSGIEEVSVATMRAAALRQLEAKG